MSLTLNDSESSTYAHLFSQKNWRRLYAKSDILNVTQNDWYKRNFKSSEWTRKWYEMLQTYSQWTRGKAEQAW